MLWVVAIKINAGEILRAAGGESCPVSLNPDTVRVRCVPVWIRLWWRGSFAAITMPWGIYVRHEVLHRPEQLGTLIVHELAHVEQWRRLGVVRFLRRYVGEYVSLRRTGADHMSAYRGISLEADARQVSGES